MATNTDIFRAVGCPRCGVSKGKWCHDLIDKRRGVPWLHNARRRAYRLRQEHS